jgi:prevent-host-death family protein
MRKSRPTKKNVNLQTAQEELGRLLKQVQSGKLRIVIESDGTPVAAVISVQDLDLFEFLEHKRDERFEILKEIGDAFKDVPPEELEQEVARAITEVRAESRKDSQPDALTS